MNLEGGTHKKVNVILFRMEFPRVEKKGRTADARADTTHHSSFSSFPLFLDFFSSVE